MHTGNQYKLREFILWTRHEIYGLTLLAALPTVLFQIFHIKWLALPWVPIALIGTAAAYQEYFNVIMRSLSSTLYSAQSLCYYLYSDFNAD
jgi:hypothetical protein